MRNKNLKLHLTIVDIELLFFLTTMGVICYKNV